MQCISNESRIARFSGETLKAGKAWRSLAKLVVGSFLREEEEEEKDTRPD